MARSGRRFWPLLLVLCVLPHCRSFVWHDSNGAVSKSISILAGVTIVFVWECFCSIFLAAKPTIITELINLIVGKEAAPSLPHRKTVGSLLSSKSREFTSVAVEGEKQGKWSARAVAQGEQEAMTPWEREEAAPGPAALAPKEKGSVVFFANHTSTVVPTTGVAKVHLVRVGDISSELAIEVGTIDGTAFAGKKYKALRHRVVFAPKSATASFEVELLPHYAATSSFFVIHVYEVKGNATLGGSGFTRVRLMPTGPWPEGAPSVQARDNQWTHLKLVFAFARGLLKRRGRVLWHYIGSMVWAALHNVVINTLLLNYALYDFCLTSKQVEIAMRRLPLIALAKLGLVCLDRMSNHIQATSGGAGGQITYLQQVLIHRYLQMADDSVDMGKFLHLLSETAPDSITNGYSTVYQIVSCCLTMFLSVLMALIMPVLKGSELSFANLQPVIWVIVPLYFTFFMGFWLRRHEFKLRAKQAAKAQIEKNETMIDLLGCRHWMRAYDSCYPVQHVRQAFDDACAYTGSKKGAFGVFTLDSQAIATYSGELTKIFGILFGGYATLETLQTGEGDFTLGRFTVFLSLYGIIINAMYTLMKSWDGLVYASMLVEELADFINEPDRFTHKIKDETSFDVKTHPLLNGSFDIKLDAGDFHLGASPTDHPKGTVNVPLGGAYGVKTFSDASLVRKRVCEILGGLRAAKSDDLVSCARHLLLAPPISMVSGSFLDNLLASAPAWVRGRDVQVLLSLLGIPIPAPAGAQPVPEVTTKKLWDLIGQSSELPDEEEVKVHFDWFKARCEKFACNLLSNIEDAEGLMQPAEQHLFDIARAMLADPEIIVLHDMLTSVPLPLAKHALQVLLLWQRFGGLKGLALAFDGKLHKLPEGYPDWMSVSGEIPRSLFVSESSIVNHGLGLDKQLDGWLAVLQGGGLELQATGIKRQGSVFGF